MGDGTIVPTEEASTRGPARVSNRGLVDDDIATFLDQGYLVLNLDDVDESVHRQLFEDAQTSWAANDALGGSIQGLELVADNLPARLPTLKQILGSKALDAALTDLLGERYYRYAHNFIHRSTQFDQGFHKDSTLPWSLRGALRSHRPNWLIAFYYPQKTTLDMGPTHILPGSQYWNVDHEAVENVKGEDRLDYAFEADQVGRNDDTALRDRMLRDAVRTFEPALASLPVEVPAGSVVLVHFDLVHRASGTVSPDDRFMFKFWFCRTMEPRPRGPVRVTSEDARREPVAQAISDWLTQTPSESQFIPIETPRSEADRVQRAYALGLRADVSLPEGLFAGAECDRRATMYGLTAAQDLGLEAAVLALQSREAGIRNAGALVLGELGIDSEGAIEALARVVMLDQIPEVRATAVMALGRIGRRSLAQGRKRLLEKIVDAIYPATSAVREKDVRAGVLPMNAVRQSAAVALLMIVTEAISAGVSRREVASLTDMVLEMAETDSDRYARSTAIEAAQRLALGGVDEVLPGLFRQLADSRWQPGDELDITVLKANQSHPGKSGSR
ncbi:MAG: phytanoyl-CoA dioxygenase family protein [Proteobacteria bacterium]|jgi:ectoine hydroxylase-related dioxygenase (phytanoyl-CoA dioxygenase family)|nr:phytanoyl-CoA dioxygenase family protein [Pseudomonadota bacterium]